jgi:hypothetical protein
MTLSSNVPFGNLPAAALDVAISFLLPLILPALGQDATAARTLALHMLGEYDPQSVRELRLAAEAIGFSLKSLTVLGESAEPDMKPEQRDGALKWACSLNRSSHQAHRRLLELQRAGRTAPVPEPALPEPIAEEVASPATAPQPEADNAASGIAAAEATLASATKLLNLMKAHYKGAPPPHSSAAQQIQAQQRVVETARLKLQQARRAQAATPQLVPEQAAA